VVAKGLYAPAEFGSGLLVHPHLHAITRLACDIVSCETLEAGVARKALFEKSIADFVSDIEELVLICGWCQLTSRGCLQ
jgi:hypothetical protein